MITVCSWTSDLESVVLEVVDNKTSSDTDRSTWRALLQEFEDESIIDVSINGHDCQKPAASSDPKCLLPVNTLFKC